MAKKEARRARRDARAAELTRRADAADAAAAEKAEAAAKAEAAKKKEAAAKAEEAATAFWQPPFEFKLLGQSEVEVSPEVLPTEAEAAAQVECICSPKYPHALSPARPPPPRAPHPTLARLAAPPYN